MFCSFFSQLQTIENVEELRAVFASLDGMDVLSHIGLRSIPSKADMTCKQVVLRYLTVFYQHCYCRCKVKSFSFLGWFVSVSMYFFLGCFVYYISVLFVCFNREFAFPSDCVLFCDLPFSPHKLWWIHSFTHEIYCT